MELENEVLKRVVPDLREQSRIDRAVSELCARVREIAAERALPVTPMLVGSVAKGTHLKSPDVDLFVRFPTDYGKEEMADANRRLGFEILDSPEERYAEHPYVGGFWHGFRTDLVPCYAVASGRGRISAVDRTPFHTEYVRSHLTAEQRDQVRLLKQFAKGVGVYGAEARVQGFSGYLCELLILRFDDFAGVISSARKWRRRQELRLEERSDKAFDEPLIFVDPVDPGRNVASPVSSEKLALFVEACRAYSKRSSIHFFFPKGPHMLTDAELERQLADNPGTVLVELRSLDVVDDVLWPQLRKTGVSVFEFLDRSGFRPGKQTLAAEDGMNVIVQDCGVAELPGSYAHLGPPVDSPEADNFLDKWSGKGLSEPTVVRGKWQVNIGRQLRRPDELLSRRIRSLRLGKGFRSGEDPVIVSGQALLDGKYRRVLSEHFEKRRPWER